MSKYVNSYILEALQQCDILHIFQHEKLVIQMNCLITYTIYHLYKYIYVINEKTSVIYLYIYIYLDMYIYIYFKEILTSPSQVKINGELLVAPTSAINFD